MGKYGTNYTGFGAFEGGVNMDKGAPLLSTNSDGETALLAGPSLLREIQTGVANGDFAIPPDAASANIAEDNALPYWTITTTGSTCSAAMVADSGAASGQVLQITVGAGTGGTLTLSRYIPIPGTRAQTFCVQPVLTMGGASNATDAQLYALGSQYNSAGSTVGSTVTLSTYQFSSYTGTVVNLLPDVDASAAWKDSAVQPSAAFYKVSIVFSNNGTTASARTIKVYDVRLLLGSTDVTIAESTTPGTYGPAYLRQESGQLKISADFGTSPINGLTVTSSGASVTGDLSVSGQLTSNSTSMASGVFTVDASGQITGLNQLLSGSNGYSHNTPLTTTQTTSAAIWVLVSGSTYRIRRNSSSARYKTDIVDADDLVLEAARKVKPRHYKSTIDDENGATRLGFIAEEIHDAGLTHAVGYDTEGKPETIDPTALIAALWHRVSDLEDRLKALESR